MRRTASWILALLAAVALTIGVLAGFASRTVFSADGFADHTEATLRSGPVSAEIARRLTDAAIRAQPDLIAVRPLVTSAAEGVVRSAAFRSVVRAAARDVHRSVFDRDATTVTLTVVDAGVLLSEALNHLRPDLAKRVPAGLRVPLSGAGERAAVRTLDVAERVRHLTLISLVAGLRERIGYSGGGAREIFLCHAFCEVGATPAVQALAGVHRFLLAHPEEVLILSIEDDTDAADTAKLLRDSGLIREVYRGPAKPPWPTLRELIERDERVLVLVENDAGTEPWMHKQSAVMQETPYRFNTAAELAAPTACEPNRGGTAGSLLLVNHWVDTSPAPRKTIARQVNAPAVLGARLQRCRDERRLLPTVVAVDFYRQGNVFDTVDRLTQPR